MKLIFFSFKHRYRKKELNNFLNSRIYGKYFILNLGGPIKYLFAKLLIFFKIGKAISCDGRPLITDASKGINFWMRGTALNIPKDLRNLNNNLVTINNPLLKDKKVFQVYPINIKKAQIKDDIKIIYISRIDVKTNAEEKDIWEKNKTKLINNFNLINDRDFWKKIVTDQTNEMKIFILYQKIKLLLRYEIIKNLENEFNKKMLIVGDDWKSCLINSIPSNFNIKEIKKLYEGNICLDLGSMLGSISLYSRSNQIIESGGLIIQSYQTDSNEIWGKLNEKILFNNLSDLIFLLKKLLSNKEHCSSLLKEIYDNFNESNKLIEKSLDKTFIN